MGFAVAVTQTQTPRAVVIWNKWISSYNEAQAFNNGLNRRRTYTIFYSTDIGKDANFQLETIQTIQGEVDSCYRAHLYKFFGKY